MNKTVGQLCYDMKEVRKTTPSQDRKSAIFWAWYNSFKDGE